MTAKAIGQSLTGLCWNLTVVRDGQPTADRISGPLSVRLSAELDPDGSTNGTTGLDQSEPEFSSRDKHALLYIIVVLLFYSTGIVIAIVNYLKREKKEIEEEKAYEDYALFRSDPDKMARYFRVQRMISYLNEVEQARETAALSDRLQGRASQPPPVATSAERPARIDVAAARFDHVTRSPFKHKGHHVTAEPQVDDARRQDQGASADYCCREDVGDNREPAAVHVHPPGRTWISQV